ncbi:MAG: hypothetical protein Q7J63_12695 [Rhodonellum sp.]|nr:hypothetical protein [Rhodonellum sp.]
MEQQNIFPETIHIEGKEQPEIQLEGRKVLFDKKVSLLPEKIKRSFPDKRQTTLHE